MRYGGVGRDEMEVVIRLDQTDRQAHISSTWPEWSRKLEKLFGCPKKETHQGEQITSAFWIVPIQCVMVRKAKRRVTLTPEQRQALSDRLVKANLRRARPRPQANSPTIP